MGNRARLGYAEFDVHLRKAHFVTTLYGIHTSVHTYAIWQPRVFASSPHDTSIRMILSNPGNAQVCPGLQVPMSVPMHQSS